VAKLAGSVLLSLLFTTACKKTDDFQVPPHDLIDAAIDGKPADARPDARMLDAFQPDGAPDALLDHLPPVITVTAPVNTLIYAGQVAFTVNVMDAEKITSVTATIGGNHAVTLGQNAMMPNEWDGTFDSTLIAGVVAPSVVVRAINAEGLMASVSFEITLDNQPPIVEMDPPKVRTSAIDQMMTTKFDCSDAFDPVSPDAPSDGSSVAQLIEFRARIVDLPNSGTVTSTLFIPKAGVQTATLYVLDDTTRPLVVDTNGDGFCDNINPLIVPVITPNQPNEAATVSLSPVGGAGTPYFSNAAPDGQTSMAGSNLASCVPQMPSPSFMKVCTGEPAQSQIIKEPVTNSPEIFGIPPADGLNCMGYAFDAVAAHIVDGWACVAVVATDALGNRSVSPPIRVCIDSDQNGDCAAGSFGPAPNCTGTFSSGTVTSTACTFRPYAVGAGAQPQRFYNSGVANDYELIPAN
jgi:hypothetical protein